MTCAAADHAGRCLHQVWEELTGQRTGALVAEFIPLPPAGPGPEPAARLVAALPGGDPARSLSLCPAAEPGLAVNVPAGQMLAAVGLAVRAGQFRYSGSPRIFAPRS